MGNRTWSEEEERVLHEYYPLGSKDDMLSILDRTWCAIQSHSEKLGIKRDQGVLRSGSRNYNWQGGKRTYVCDACGEEFQRYPSQVVGEKKFCSKVCASVIFSTMSRFGEENPNWRHGKRIFDTPARCELCGDAFLTSKGQLEKGWGKYCSRTCHMIDIRMNQSKSWTSIEKLVYRFLLSKYGLGFIPQYHIKGYGIADFYNPDLRIIVECQGEYWHKLSRMRERDRMKRQFASDAGYQLIELWERDIKEKFN